MIHRPLCASVGGRWAWAGLSRLKHLKSLTVHSDNGGHGGSILKHQWNTWLPSLQGMKSALESPNSPAGLTKTILWITDLQACFSNALCCFRLCLCTFDRSSRCSRLAVAIVRFDVGELVSVLSLFSDFVVHSLVRWVPFTAVLRLPILSSRTSSSELLHALDPTAITHNPYLAAQSASRPESGRAQASAQAAAGSARKSLLFIILHPQCVSSLNLMLHQT